MMTFGQWGSNKYNNMTSPAKGTRTQSPNLLPSSGFESNFQTPSYLTLQSRLSYASIISLIICTPNGVVAIWTVLPSMFTLMVWSPPELASSGGFGNRSKVVTLALSAKLTLTLDSVASGLQYGLWCFRSCKADE